VCLQTVRRDKLQYLCPEIRVSPFEMGVSLPDGRLNHLSSLHFTTQHIKSQAESFILVLKDQAVEFFQTRIPTGVHGMASPSIHDCLVSPDDRKDETLRELTDNSLSFPRLN
jgi:hypothetical protein